MAVSIMLTSCGKSAGLSNRNKGTDNKTLSAAGAGKKQLPQGTNYKNSSKKTPADTIKEYWHTTSDFFYAHRIGLGVSSVLLILAGLVYYYRQDIFNPEQIKEADKIVEKVNKLVSDNEALKRKNNGLEDDKKKLMRELSELIGDKSSLLSEDQRKTGAISKFKMTVTRQKNKIAEQAEIIERLNRELQETISNSQQQIAALEKSKQNVLDQNSILLAHFSALNPKK
jgi:hypothetical protein